MIDPIEHEVVALVVAMGYNYGDELDWPIEDRLDLPFTRSNGTRLSRIYERLTKASRRRTDGDWNAEEESFYRQGVYDAFKALQEELK